MLYNGVMRFLERREVVPAVECTHDVYFSFMSVAVALFVEFIHRPMESESVNE